MEDERSCSLRHNDTTFLGVGSLGLHKYWRYGDTNNVELPMKFKVRNPEAVNIPLKVSNTVEFEVVRKRLHEWMTALLRSGSLCVRSRLDVSS